MSKKAIGETLYSIVYGTEALLPVEVNYPTIRTEIFEPEANDGGLRKNFDYLDEKKKVGRAQNKSLSRKSCQNLEVKSETKEYSGWGPGPQTNQIRMKKAQRRSL